MISLLTNWRIALGEIRANWFRASLTALGVIIGVASLVAVTAVSAGAQAGIRDSLRRLGANVVIVNGEFITIGAVQSVSERTLTPGDLVAIAKLPMVSAAAPHQDIDSIVASAGRHTTTTFVKGMTPAYAGIHNRTMRQGREISAADVSFGRSVIVLGARPRALLFPGQNPIGKTVRMAGHEFEVIGVLARRGVIADTNLDDLVFIPLPIATQVFPDPNGVLNVHNIDVRVRSEADVNPVQDTISTLLHSRHRLPSSYPDDFSTEDQAAVLQAAQSASTTFRVLTLALGGIALLVGGIGIMNMMLVSVHERTREIGIRKSVGADPARIQAQFLLEAVVLSTLGGVAGVLAGVGVTQLISTLAGWQTLISPLSLLLAFSVALAVGLFFGYYPARRAARFDPIVALRYE